MSAQAIGRAIQAAVGHLELGEEAPATVELERVLKADPNQRLAKSLMRQINEDPQVLLGRESSPYRVQPGETLSRIAQRFLGDVYLFYALARYNGVKVPRRLGAGEMIRVPGKLALPAAVTADTARAAPPAPRAATEPAAMPAPIAASAPSPSPAAQVATDDSAMREQRIRSEAIARHARAARSAFAKQDLDGAIRSWDAVLALDPGNQTAHLERQRTLDLKERLKTVR
jgi:hypothetical protein